MARKPAVSRKPAARSTRRGAGRGKTRLLGFLGAAFLFCAITGGVYLREPAASRSFEGALNTSGRLVGNAAQAVGDIGAKVTQPPAPGQYLVARVERVVDGDTIIVSIADREERVRLLNVDTPESVHPDKSKNTQMGKLAAEYTRVALEGRQVRLEGDSETETRDRYGRLLSYVLVDGTNFNVALVREGFSGYEVEFGASRRYDRDFQNAESAARETGRGIWSDGRVASAR